MNNKLIVTGYPERTDANELLELFWPYGQVWKVDVRPAYVLIEMEDELAADRAMMHVKTCDGKRLKIRKANW